MADTHISVVNEYLKDRGKGKMASPQLKLTQALLKALPSDDTEYAVRDTEQAGLRARVHPKGGKVIEVYKKPTGSNKAVTVRICKFGELPVTGKNSIRTKAQQVLAELVAGHNPNVVKSQKVEDITLSQALEQYLDEQTTHSSRPMAESTEAKYRQVVNKHAKKWLQRPLRDLTPNKALKLHRDVSEKSQAQANYLIRVLRALVNYTNDMNMEYPQFVPIANPALLITRRKSWNTEIPRSRTLDAETLPDWWQAVGDIADEQANGQLWSAYLRCTLLMGARMRELLKLTWDDVDLKNGTITLRDTKAGNDVKLPVSQYVLTLLKERHKVAQNESGPFALKSPRVVVARVIELSSVTFTMHDLRRTFASVGEKVVSYASLKRLLNHSIPASDITLRHYINLDVERLRDDTQAITDAILKLAGVTKPKAKVTRLRRSK